MGNRKVVTHFFCGAFVITRGWGKDRIEGKETVGKKCYQYIFLWIVFLLPFV